MTAQAGRTGRTAGPLRVRGLARPVAALLVAGACDAPAAFRAGTALGLLVVAVAGVAWWLAPLPDDRPPAASAGWAVLGRRRSPTVVASAAVLLAAVTGPPPWLAACVTLLLIGYLLLTDPWVTGAAPAPSRGRSRGPRPPLVAAGACAVVFLAAELPLPEHLWTRLPAVLVVAAVSAVLLTALLRRNRPGTGTRTDIGADTGADADGG